MEISAADIDPQPKRNQKPRPKKQTVGKPKLSKIFEVNEGKGCLPDRPAGHTAHYIKRTGSAPTSAPPNASRRPVTVYTDHRHRTGTI